MINMEDHGGSRGSREGGIDVVINMEDHGGSRDSGAGRNRCSDQYG